MTDIQKRVEKVANTSYPTKYYAEVLLIKDLGIALQELTVREAKAVKALEYYADFAKNTTMDGAYCDDAGVKWDAGSVAQVALEELNNKGEARCLETQKNY